MVALGDAASVAERLKSLHQTMDSVSVCKPVTKYAAEVDSPASTAEVLAAAFRAAESARPGSAFVGLPTDVMTGEAQCKPVGLSSFSKVCSAHPRANESNSNSNYRVHHT
jgi:acetolactate synthase-1/2/3 large subunit